MQTRLSSKKREWIAGAFMVAIGSAVVLEANSYRVGELARMGPGFFPVALGIILILLGLVIPFVSEGADEPEDSQATTAVSRLRGTACIIGGVAAFMVLGKFAGLAPAIFSLVFISAMGDTHNTIKSAALLALCMTILGIVLFVWALPLQFPVFR